MPLSQLNDAEGALLPATDVPAELLNLFESVRDQRVGVFCASGCASAALCAGVRGTGRRVLGAPHGYLSVYKA